MSFVKHLGSFPSGKELLFQVSIWGKENRTTQIRYGIFHGYEIMYGGHTNTFVKICPMCLFMWFDYWCTLKRLRVE